MSADVQALVPLVVQPGGASETFAALQQAVEAGAWVHLQAVQAGGGQADGDPSSSAFDWPLGGGVVLASGGSQGGAACASSPGPTWIALLQRVVAGWRGLGSAPRG